MSVRSLGCPKMESSSAQLEDKTKELEALVQQYPFETSLSKDVLNKIAQLVKNFIGEIEDLKTQHQKYRIYQFLKSKDWSWSVEKKGTDPRITHLVLSWTLKILEADVTSQQISTDRLFQMKPEKIDEANKALKELVQKVISDKSASSSTSAQRVRATSLGSSQFPKVDKSKKPPILDRPTQLKPIASEKSKIPQPQATNPSSPSTSTTQAAPQITPKSLLAANRGRTASLGTTQFPKVDKSNKPPIPSRPKPTVAEVPISVEPKEWFSIKSTSSSPTSTPQVVSQTTSKSSSLKNEVPESISSQNADLEEFKSFLLPNIKNEKSYLHALQDYRLALQDYENKNILEFDKAFINLNTEIFRKIEEYLIKIKKRELALPPEVSPREFLLIAYLLHLYMRYLDRPEMVEWVGEKLIKADYLINAISYSMLLQHFIDKLEKISFPPFSKTGSLKIRDKEVNFAYTPYRITEEGIRCTQLKFKEMFKEYIAEGTGTHPFKTAKVSYFNTYRSTIPDWINEWLEKAK